MHRLPPGPPSLPRPKVMTSRALAARPGLLTDFLNLCVYSDSEDSFGAVFAPLWTVLDLMTHGCFIEEANRSKELANTRRGFPFQTVSSRPASGDASRVRRAPKQHGASFLPRQARNQRNQALLESRFCYAVCPRAVVCVHRCVHTRMR